MRFRVSHFLHIAWQKELGFNITPVHSDFFLLLSTPARFSFTKEMTDCWDWYGMNE